jgi:hypothetical protein
LDPELPLLSGNKRDPFSSQRVWPLRTDFRDFSILRILKNLEDFPYIAYTVEIVKVKIKSPSGNGGPTVGELIDTIIKGVGKISIVYAKDPEGNIIEIQK